jgi:uncharacterized protein (TIGR03067 family)
MARIAILTFALVLPGSLFNQAGDAKKDQELLQGEWKVESMQESDGKNPAAAHVMELTLLVKGDAMKMVRKDEPVMSYKFRLDASKKPKMIDFLVQDGPDKGKTEQGIYQIEGAKVTFCINDPGKPRPATFATQAGTKISLIVISRAK